MFPTNEELNKLYELVKDPSERVGKRVLKEIIRQATSSGFSLGWDEALECEKRINDSRRT